MEELPVETFTVTSEGVKTAIHFISSIIYLKTLTQTSAKKAALRKAKKNQRAPKKQSPTLRPPFILPPPVEILPLAKSRQIKNKQSLFRN